MQERFIGIDVAKDFRTFRERLSLAGKPTNATLIATARKLLVTLATGTDFDPATAS